MELVPKEMGKIRIVVATQKNFTVEQEERK